MGVETWRVVIEERSMRNLMLASLALILPLSLAACGSDERVTERTTTSTTSTPSTTMTPSDLAPSRSTTVERETTVKE
jgi:hypothetical protein